ncbi:MAG: glycine dehydrogenase (aminomethyl-transferring) [SAR202 cluster bacterium Io17-Chloro-G3]|nr:MAG: glycine dehydrogenase (aminomethyl-transferring) [SAR202 cluster bacterium Io17-Chloro-G3]
MTLDRKLLMERSVPGRRALQIPNSDVPLQPMPSLDLLREDLELPELSQPEVVRYFTRLSQLNYSVDTNFYPLGSCTMKYNPKINDQVASIPGMAALHPLAPTKSSQGALNLLYRLQGYLTEITGMAGVSLAPIAGAHAELSGVLMIRAFHEERGDHHKRTMLIPDSAHGTNPASAAMAGFQVASIPSDARGNMDLASLKSAVGRDLAGLMLTLPSTLGLFETDILEICKTVHEAGGLVYGDGANMNALLGQTKLGALGFDVVHLNLHKTFSTPHGGGGPGAGPVCAVEKLMPYLPAPVVIEAQDGAGYSLGRPKNSIGKVGAFHGNFGVLVRAYAYIRALGGAGLRAVSEDAVLNANYLLARLKGTYDLAYDRLCMHEVVISARRQKNYGVKGLDIAKRLLDYGFHAPTMYFPLIVDEALMIEPTETESKETLDSFIEALLTIDQEAEKNPELLQHAPHTTPVSRMDEARAARKPDLRWNGGGVD